MIATASTPATTMQIIVFNLGDQQSCTKTTSIWEIQGWAAALPLRDMPSLSSARFAFPRSRVLHAA